jgi:hypothetical protein
MPTDHEVVNEGAVIVTVRMMLAYFVVLMGTVVMPARPT